jgi:Asp-tRNA(Asn)/Glu-tRNA(Gln) amidotransferase A subunit family amidase
MENLSKLTISKAAEALRAKEISVRELWDTYTAQARAHNAPLNAYLELFPADTEAIDRAQKRIDTEGNAGVLERPTDYFSWRTYLNSLSVRRQKLCVRKR